MSAATVELYNVNPDGYFSQDIGDNRQTLIEVLHEVRITELGVQIDPVQNTVVTWNVYNASETGTAGSLIHSAKSEVLNDEGKSVYDTAVNFTLGAGFYFLEMNSNTDVLHRRYVEINALLPFVTSDGNFKVHDGAHGFDFGLRNVFLPAFSLTASSTTTPIPVPASLPLYLGAVCGLCFIRRRKH